jgi:hypothetical protein
MLNSESDKREYLFISQFLSAYDGGSWADAEHSQPDKIDRKKPAVEWLAKRKPDGKTLAIEHTIIEPFIGDKSDFAAFSAAFLEIERDTSLWVPGRWIRVFVPVGSLQNKRKNAERIAVVRSVHAWIEINRFALSNGISQHSCPVSGIPGRVLSDITLTVKVVPLEHGVHAESGLLHVRRQQVEDDLDKVIDKALRTKVPKLVNTAADKRILLLERQHMNLTPKRILREIESRRPSVPALALVNEIWIVETPLYGTAFGGTWLRFELYENDELIHGLDFNEEKLVMSEGINDSWEKLQSKV